MVEIEADDAELDVASSLEAMMQRISEIEQQEKGLAAEKAQLQGVIEELLAEQAQREKAAKEDSNTIRINVRKSDTRNYFLDVDPDITINQLKLMVIDQIAAEMSKKGATDNRKPFDERQMDIFDPNTCKVMFMGKKLSQLGVKDGDTLLFNIRQWTGGHY